MRTLGRRHRHVDWQAITSGTAQYVADVRQTDELHAAVLRSPHPHARIRSIDTRAARRLPGVHAVLTAADVTDNRYLDYREPDRDRRVLARDVVRYVGEPVALVAAETPQAADRAIEAIRVRYRRLPTLDTIEKAVAPGAPPINAEVSSTNVAATVQRSLGDGTALDSSTHRVAGRYLSSYQSHATMEPHTVTAHWRRDEKRLHLWVPSQNPRLIQRDLAQLFDLQLEQVRLHEVTVGGDFGGRTQISSTEALAAALSLATGRPVKLRQGRADEFAFTKYRVPWDLRLELGCDAGGRVTGLRADFDVDNGAYNQAAPGEMSYGSIALGSTYRWRGYQADGRCVYTTKVPSSSFRGAGGYAVTWASECAIDELAEAAGWDPIDFRLHNAVANEGEVSLTGWRVKSSGLARCLDTVRREIDWDRKRRAGGHGRGVGVACVMHVTALSRDYMLRSSAALDVDADGRVTLRSGCGDAGTGQKTILCQAVAEVLEIDPAGVSIVSIDTDHTPHDSGAGASRGSFVSVSTARQLAESARDRLVDTAADKFHADRDDITWTDGCATYEAESLSIGDLATLAADGKEAFTAETEFLGESHDPAPDGHEDIAPTYSFAAHAVEVDVDQTTGQVNVVNVVAAHDSGTVLNSLSAQGQVEGGVVMGMGAVLSESLLFEDGRVVNPSYVDYAVPRAAEAPPISTHFVETNDSVGPFGAKGIGEIPLLAIGPAITNAIAHATGVRLREAPHTPDKVLTALRQRDGQTMQAGSVGRSPRRWWIEAMRWCYPRGLHRVLRRVGPIVARSKRPSRIARIERPSSALAAEQQLVGDVAAPLGGGTDVLARETQGLPVPRVLVDLTGVRDLANVREEPDGALTIGAAVTLSELEHSRLADTVLRETAASIATPQLRAVATVGGNLCQEKRCWFFRNGFDCYKRGGVTRPCYAVMGDHRFYHAVEDGHRCQATTPSDLATTLIALDATAEIRSAKAVRWLNVADLFVGPGETAVRPDEFVSAVRIPSRGRERTTTYRKFALWQGGFAIGTVAVSARDPHSGIGNDVRVVLGGVSDRPLRVVDVERLLEGATIDYHLIDKGCQAWTYGTHPLPGNQWKVFAVADLLRTGLRDLYEEALA